MTQNETTGNGKHRYYTCGRTGRIKFTLRYLVFSTLFIVFLPYLF